VPFAGASIMSVEENIRVDELNAHATRPESTRSRREFLCRERFESYREIAGRPLNCLSLDRSFFESLLPLVLSWIDCARRHKREIGEEGARAG
jgi:hypothetical protein